MAKFNLRDNVWELPLAIHLKTTILLFLSTLIISGKSVIHPDNQEERPNILWLVTEDNSQHYLKLYNPDGASMPHIEALAKKGIVYNHAFSQAPVCSVARSTIISGCYAPRIGAQYHRRMQKVPMPEGLKMFPEYLREAGYYTSNNSKEDYNIIKSGKEWDESSRTASYNNRKDDQPFFHVQNFGTTHEGKLHFSKQDMRNNATQTIPSEVSVFPYHPNSPTFQYTVAHYHDLHQKVDQQIGKFLEQLESDGLMENTIIFYYGDHGGVLPRSKGYIYESGLHVPMVVYFPEKWKHLAPEKLGSRSDAFIGFIDLAPTVLNLAGINISPAIDGKPFLGKSITSETLSKSNSVFSYADRFDEKYDLTRSIRKGKFKYIRNYQPFNVDALYNFYRYKMLGYKEWADLFAQGKLNKDQNQFFEPRTPEALYNLEDDPHELNNLANDPTLANTLLELRSILQKKVKSMPDLSFFPEPYFLDNGLDNPVRFGQKNQARIKALIDIADLSLQQFDEVKPKIKKALKSSDPWKKYWALIVCSSYGEEAMVFKKRIQKIIRKDNDRLVKMRAIEYLGLIGMPTDDDIIKNLVYSAKSNTEANLLLNSIALLKQTNPKFNIKIQRDKINPKWIAKENDLVNRRIQYLNKE